MADYITDDADLFAGDYIPRAEYVRLTPQEWRDAPGVQGPWTPRHKRAWTEVLARLAARRDPIAETDLLTPSELLHPVCLYVVYLAYRMGGHGAKTEEALAKFQSAMNGVNPTLTGGSAAPNWGYEIPINRC